MDLPLAPVKRILEKTGLRVSKSAVEEFALLLEEVISDIAAESVAIAKANGRKTVLLSDIKEVRKRFM
jgi:histone H3/H4